MSSSREGKGRQRGEFGTDLFGLEIRDGNESGLNSDSLRDETDFWSINGFGTGRRFLFSNSFRSVYFF